MKCRCLKDTEDPERPLSIIMLPLLQTQHLGSSCGRAIVDPASRDLNKTGNVPSTVLVCSIAYTPDGSPTLRGRQLIGRLHV
jgi:hypothetical protein